MHIVALRVFGIAFSTLRVVARAMAMSAAEAEEFFDQMLSQANDFEFAARNYPVLNPTVIDEQNLQRDHWRFLQPLPPKKKKVWSFFDVVDSWQPPSDTWDASSLDDVAVAVKKHGNAKLADFPYGLPPKLHQIEVQRHEDPSGGNVVGQAVRSNQRVHDGSGDVSCGRCEPFFADSRHVFRRCACCRLLAPQTTAATHPLRHNTGRGASFSCRH